MPDSPTIPKLLVSVRNTAEAKLAASAGAELVDIKEPVRGPLGFAGIKTVTEVAQSTNAGNLAGPELSIALGELRDWTGESVPALPAAIRYAKLGLAGVRDRTGWVDRWCRARQRFDTAAGRNVNWIAVFYADTKAGAPPLSEVFAAAESTGCAGVLIDTYEKSAGGLFGHLAEADLARSISRAKECGLLIAVAGGLQAGDLPRVAGLAPHIIAVRGAACAGGDRSAGLDRRAILQLRAAIGHGPRHTFETAQMQRDRSRTR